MQAKDRARRQVRIRRIRTAALHTRRAQFEAILAWFQHRRQARAMLNLCMMLNKKINCFFQKLENKLPLPSHSWLADTPRQGRAKSPSRFEHQRDIAIPAAT